MMKEALASLVSALKPGLMYRAQLLPGADKRRLFLDNEEKPLRICLAQCHCPHDCCRHYRWHPKLDSCGSRKCNMLGIMVKCSTDPDKPFID